MRPEGRILSLLLSVSVSLGQVWSQDLESLRPLVSKTENTECTLVALDLHADIIEKISSSFHGSLLILGNSESYVAPKVRETLFRESDCILGITEASQPQVCSRKKLLIFCIKTVWEKTTRQRC